MTAKISAFSVFKAREKTKLYSVEHHEKLHRRNSLPAAISIDNKENPTPESSPKPSKLSKHGLKSEPRLSSLRKSMSRKKSKRESHHDIKLKNEKKTTKSGSVLKLFDRDKWTESMQDLNSSSLEREFLPEVVKQKNQQKQLHKQLENSPMKSASMLELPSETNIANDSTRPVNRKRPSSVTSMSSLPPIPFTKKSKQSVVISTTCPDNLEKNAADLFNWVISPIKANRFFSEAWQKKPLFIKRKQVTYNNSWFSTKELDAILRQQTVEFTKNLDIAVYRDGRRETLNPSGRAYPAVVWNFYQEGCSIRLLNPQTFSSNVCKILSRLQEYFGCFVGSNVYLTPPGSQGFAPHYDDIEAFIIQLEGKKHWKLYNPRNINEVLPRYSSANLSQEELGEPILDKVLEAGDTLYFPRGVIHQATTSEDTHSLHITLSVYQKNSWADYLEKLIPMALQTAIEEDVAFREGLPLNFSNYIGLAHSDKTSSERSAFIKNVQHLMQRLVAHVNVDEAADELALDSLEEYLPPHLSQDDIDCSVHGTGSFWNNGTVSGTSKVLESTELRLVRPGIARIIPVNENIEVHHSVENSRQYKQKPLQVLRFSVEEGDMLDYFILSFPGYVKVANAPGDDSQMKIKVASCLYETGLLRSKEPLVQDTPF